MQPSPTQTIDRRIGYSLLLANGWAIGLLLIRFYLTNRLTYAFLLWNLVLAWVPLLCAWMIYRTKKPMRAWGIQWIAVFLWVIFFPNAPYLLTDLGHLARLSEWALAPLGLDVVIILSFTLNGLFLAFLSLFLMEAVWHRTLRSRTVHTLSILLLVLTGFGMYLGRFLRWNSWDIFQQPAVLAHDLFVRIADPLSHGMTWGFTALYTGFLVVLYGMICIWRKTDE